VGTALKDLTREELEAEVVRLRGILEGAAIDSSQRAQVAADSATTPASSRAAPQNSTERQQAIFESAIDIAMIVTNRAGIITDWNPGAALVLGWSAEEMLGQTAERFFTPADRATGQIEREMQRALHDGRAADERWHLRKGDQPFWASGEMMRLYGDNNVHLGFVKILRDRTNEHLAGRAVEETQERYRLAAKATSDAIWDWDLHANQILWN
jgi:PAS domain S-box-containing protein